MVKSIKWKSTPKSSSKKESVKKKLNPNPKNQQIKHF